MTIETPLQHSPSSETLTTTETTTEETTENMYESVEHLDKTGTEEVTTTTPPDVAPPPPAVPPLLRSRSSAMELLQEVGRRSMWAELPEVIDSGVLGKDINVKYYLD